MIIGFCFGKAEKGLSGIGFDALVYTLSDTLSCIKGDKFLIADLIEFYWGQFIFISSAKSNPSIIFFFYSWNSAINDTVICLLGQIFKLIS